MTAKPEWAILEMASLAAMRSDWDQDRLTGVLLALKGSPATADRPGQVLVKLAIAIADPGSTPDSLRDAFRVPTSASTVTQAAGEDFRGRAVTWMHRRADEARQRYRDGDTAQPADPEGGAA